jgi:solute:Na+ symporter, SSS family
VPALMEWHLGHSINALYTFPIIFGVSAIGCLAGTLLTRPESDEILMSFYKTVNPWGAWGPIRAKVLRADPSFQPNQDFGKDTVNVLVGIVWQLCLTALPIYLVMRNWRWVGMILAVFAATTIFIKRNWYDRLEPEPVSTKMVNVPRAQNASR